jgi:hypothetical protein
MFLIVPGTTTQRIMFTDGMLTTTMTGYLASAGMAGHWNSERELVAILSSSATTGPRRLLRISLKQFPPQDAQPPENTCA